MMFLDCPAYLDGEGAVRWGLPAKVRCQFTMRSTSGPLESAMIGCPAGHWFSGPLKSLTRDGGRKHARGQAGAVASAGPGGPEGRAAEFKDLEGLERWRMEPEHLAAQRRGRSSSSTW